MLRALARPASSRLLLRLGTRCASSHPPPPPPPPSGAPHDGPSDAELRTRLLEKALLEVPAAGWSVDALTAGATACGLSPMAHGLLPRGPVELVEFFSAKCDGALAADMAARADELRPLEPHNRLLVAMRARLQMVAPYAPTWSQALALRALPANLPHSLRDGHALASLLLEVAGEGASEPLLPTPIDPHVKALGIGAAYGAAELYLLTDASPDLSDTWAFLEREVDALHMLANAKRSMPDLSLAALVLAALARRK